jgi:gluconolactonase
LDFYKSRHVGTTQFVKTDIVKADPSLDQIVAPGTQLEKVAGGFLFT